MSNVEVGRAPDRDGKVRRHGPEAFAGMRKAGQLAAAALDMLTEHVKPGVTTEELDELIGEFSQKAGADELLRAVVALCRSLCMTTSQLVHTIDGDLTNPEVFGLTDDDLLPVAMEVIRAYGNAAARDAEERAAD